MTGSISGLGTSIIIAALLHGCIVRQGDVLSGRDWAGRRAKCSVLYQAEQAVFACTDGSHEAAAMIDMRRLQ